MSKLLEVDNRSRVLEIGASSGYQIAVLARLAAQVYAIERIGELARSAQARIRQLGIYNATVKCFQVESSHPENNEKQSSHKGAAAFFISQRYLFSQAGCCHV